MHKNQDKNFAAEKQRKREKRTRKRPKRAKPGAFRVLEGMGTVENRGERMGKPSNRAEGLVSPAGSVRPGRSPLGCRPPRHAPQAGLRAHLVAKSYRTLTKKSGIAEAMPDFFWQGQKDLNPRHAVLEWMWESALGERGRGSVARFSRTSPKRVVLVWCSHQILQPFDFHLGLG